MAAATSTVAFSPSSPSFLNSHLRRGASTTTVAFFARRSRGLKPSLNRSAPVANPDDGFGALEAELWRLRRLAELRIHRLAAEADAAYRDLRSSVREVSRDRVVLTFRRSSLRFLAGALVFLLACAVAARALLGMIFRAWWRRRGFWGTGGGGGRAVVRRRDRSLGGKEVVVAAVPSSPSPSPMAVARRTSRVVPDPEPAKEEVWSWRRFSQAKKLPDWWPAKVAATVMEEPSPGPLMEKTARMANRLVRAMIDNRVMGKDYRYSDAIQLRQLCKKSGVKVSFDTENARDSFYRAAVNFVLDDCSRSPASQDIVAAKLNGEDPRDFIAGLASNIGLDEFRAATLVRASIATRTRTCFLQCWALEIQGKRPEALDELVKICRIFSVFPLEENSAEMEMVAAGLERNLRVDERVHLLDLYRSVCADGNLKTAAEALGLSLPDEMRIQQQKVQ